MSTKLWQWMMILLISSSVLVVQAQKVTLSDDKAPTKDQLKITEQKSGSVFTEEQLIVLEKQGINQDMLQDKEYQMKAEEILKMTGENPFGDENSNQSLTDFVSVYTFSQSIGTFTPISGGTLLGSTTSDDQRFVNPAVPLGGTVVTGVGFPIGFNFTYNGYVFDRVAINNNGWISLGQSALTPAVNNGSSSPYLPLSSILAIAPVQLRDRIAGIGDDLQAQAGASLRIETIGTTPNQVLVIQWLGYKKYGTGGTGDNYNFQIRLNEGTNIIDFVYGTVLNNATTNTVQVGLGGDASTDYFNRTTTTDWSATTAGAVNTASCTISSTVYPASGLTFTFTPPAAGAPGSPSNPNPTNGSSSVAISTNLTWDFGTLTETYDLFFDIVNPPLTKVVDNAVAGTGLYNPPADLSFSTPYYWQVIARNSSKLETAGPIWSFTTACDTYTVPFAEHFQTTTIPLCWQMSGPQAWLFTTTWPSYGAAGLTDHTGTGGSFAGVDGSGTLSLTGITLLSPFIDLSGLTVPQLRFYLFNNNINDASYQTLQVDLWDGDAWNNSIFFWGPTDNDPAWVEVGVVLSAYTITGDIQLRFVVDKSSGSPFYDDLIIDDVYVEEAPACIAPTAQTVTNITTVGADLGWTDPYINSFFDIFIDVTGSPAPDAGTLPDVDNNSGTSYTWSDGSSGITYDWYVRTDCDYTNNNTNVSTWTGPNTFTTLPPAHSLPLYEGFESGFTYFGNANGNDVDWSLNTTLQYNGGQCAFNDYTVSDENILHETGLLDLSATTSPILQFAHICKTEGGFDECYVEVSINGGASYTALPVLAYQGSGTYAGHFWEDSYTQWGIGYDIPDNTWWKVERFDLSGYQTTNVRFRFRLTSDSSIDRDGWYVDDIYIGEPGPASSVWNGSVKSNDWNTAGNWNNGVPGPSTDVIIPGGLTNYPTMAASGFCNTLYIESDASLLDNGYLSITNASNGVTIERTIGCDQYHSYSPSVSGATAGIFHLGGSTGLDVYLYSHSEVNNGDEEEGYFEIVDVSTLLIPMAGYAVYPDGINATPPQTSWTFVQEGGLNTGLFGSANNMTRTGGGAFAGFNYIGNPYPSFMDWEASSGWTKTQMNATIWAETNGNWAEYTAPGPGINGGSNIVAPGQGFFVEVNNAFTTGTVTMNNSVRTHTTTPYLKSSATNYVKLTATGFDKSDETVVRFDPNATVLFDGQYDGAKLAAGDESYPQFYSVSDRKLAYNALPETDWVQLGFHAGLDGEYQISATDIADISDVWLEDTFTGIYTDLTTDSYNFVYSVIDETNRFILHFTPLAVPENFADMINIFSSDKDIYVSVPASTKGDIVVYNLMGQEVARTVIKDVLNKITLNKSAYYVVKVLSNENVVTKKVFVK